MRVTVNVVLLLASVVFFVIFTIMAFDWWTVDHPTGFLGLGLVCFAGSFVSWGARTPG